MIVLQSGRNPTRCHIHVSPGPVAYTIAMRDSVPRRTSALFALFLVCLTFPAVAGDATVTITIARAVEKGDTARVAVWHDRERISLDRVEAAEATPSLAMKVSRREGAIVVIAGERFVAVTQPLAAGDETLALDAHEPATVRLVPEVREGRVPRALELTLVPCPRRNRAARPLVLPLAVDPERLRVDDAIPAGCFEISLDAPGFSSVDLGRREIATGSVLDLGAVVLQPGARVSLRVLDDASAPVGGVLVVARSTVELEGRRNPDARATPRALAHGTTDAKGWVVLDDVAADRILFEMHAKGRTIPVRSAPFDVELGRDLVIDPLVLLPPGSALVTVELPDNVAKHCEIFGVRIRSGEQSFEARRTLAQPIAADGTASFPELPPGKWTASISGRVKDGMAFEVGQTELEILPGHETLATVTFDHAVVEGVLEKDGKPYEMDGLISFRAHRAGMQPTASVAGGRFVALFVPGVRYMPRLNKPFAQPILLPMLVEAPAAGELVIELPDGEIRGRVVRDDGSPVTNAIVAVVGDAEEGMRSSPAVVANGDENGEFFLDLIAPGAWRLLATAGSEKSEPFPIEIRDGARLANVEIVIGAPQVVRGRLTGTAAQLPGARLVVTFLGGPTRGTTTQPSVSDDGTFEIPVARADRGEHANVMVLAGDRTAFSTLVPLEDGFTIAVSPAGGAVVIRRPDAAWRSDSRVPVLVAADGSSFTAYLGGTVDAEDPKALYLPRVAAGTWKLVVASTPAEHDLVRKGLANQLQPVAVFEVIDGRTAEVALPE